MNTFDSSDDEREPFEQKYNEYGKSIKASLKSDALRSKSCDVDFYGNGGKLSSWKSDRTKEKPGIPCIVTSQTQHSDTKQQTLNRPTGRTYTDIEMRINPFKPIIGISVINPLITSSTLSEKLTGRNLVQLSRLKFHTRDGDLNRDWCIAGTIVGTNPKVSAQGNKYCIWRLSDLTLGLPTASLFLFGNAYSKLWKSSIGTVIGVLNPTISKESQKGDFKEETKLTIFNPDQVMVCGTSKDFGFCKARKSDGEMCKQFVNKSQCEFCIYHIEKEYKKFSNKRSNLQSSSGGGMKVNLRNKVLGKNEVFYAGKSFTALKPTKPVKRGRIIEKDQKLLTNLFSKGTAPITEPYLPNDNKSPSKKVDYQFTRIKKIKDAETLNRLPHRSASASATSGTKEIVEIIRPSDIDKPNNIKFNQELMSDNAFMIKKIKSITKSSKIDESKKDLKTNAIDNNIEIIDQCNKTDEGKEMVDVVTSAENHLANKHKICKSPGDVEERNAKKARMKKLKEDSNGFIKPLLNDKNHEVDKKEEVNKSLQSESRLKVDESKNHKNLGESHEKIKMGRMEETVAKLKSGESSKVVESKNSISSNGSLKNENENSFTCRKRESSDKSIGKIEKDVSLLTYFSPKCNELPDRKSTETVSIGCLSDLSNNKLIDLSSPISRRDREAAKRNALMYIKKNGPIKKMDPNTSKTQESSKKRKAIDLLETSPVGEKDCSTKTKDKTSNSVLSERFVLLMNKSSKHDDLLQDADAKEREEYFLKMMTKEQMEEKMANTYKVPCKAVRCLKCKYTWFMASEFCKQDQHPIKQIDAVKRFFKCHDCGNRTISLEMIPLLNCKKCGGSNWRKTSLLPEKRTLANLNQLSIRGGEQKFINSDVTDASLNLLVPE